MTLLLRQIITKIAFLSYFEVLAATDPKFGAYSVIGSNLNFQKLFLQSQEKWE